MINFINQLISYEIHWQTRVFIGFVIIFLIYSNHVYRGAKVHLGEIENDIFDKKIKKSDPLHGMAVFNMVKSGRLKYQDLWLPFTIK